MTERKSLVHKYKQSHSQVTSWPSGTAAEEILIISTMVLKIFVLILSI